MALFEHQDPRNLISRKNLVAEKSLNFYTAVYCFASRCSHNPSDEIYVKSYFARYVQHYHFRRFWQIHYVLREVLMR